MTKETFDNAARNASPDCGKCNGTGAYKYDRNHSTICDHCCTHNMGWWQLSEGHGANVGKWCCGAGCGKVLDERPI